MNYLISLGIGSPASIGKFITLGLQAGQAVDEDEGFSGVYVRERRRQKREREKRELATKREIATIADQELAVLLLWMM